MRTERIEAIRRRIAEGYYDRPEIIAAAVHELTNALLGRKHARETELRWAMMDPSDTRAEQCLASEPAKWPRAKGEGHQNDQSGHPCTV